MSKSMDAVALSFCRAVAKNSQLSNADARFGAWLIGAANLTGGFPIDLTTHQIRAGFERAGVEVPGLGSRHETIKASIEALEDLGLLEIDEGKSVGYGHKAKRLTLRGDVW